MHKTPLDYESLTYGWVIALSSWAGVASYVQKIRSGATRFSLAELLGEICISGFIGVLTFFASESAHLNQVVSAAFIGISAHMGSRAILLAEKWFEERLKKWFDNNEHRP